MNTTVLIVEDESNFRDILRKQFTQEGYQVIESINGEEGLKQVKTKEIDLIILDLLMPKMDGITFYYHLRNTLMKDTPVLILTNLNDTVYPNDIVDVMIKSQTSLKDITAVVKKRLSEKEQMSM